MATFKIINEKIKTTHPKSFRCDILPICSFTKYLDDVLYHNGNNSLPTTNDTIYMRVNNTEYRIFNNNSACISTINGELTYIITNSEGKCIIQNC